MAEVIKFDHKKFMDYPKDLEMFERIISLVHEYDDEMSIGCQIGLIELVKENLIRTHYDE